MKQLAISLSSCLVVLTAASSMAAEPVLAPWKDNPWYWSYQAKPVMLLGGSDDDNLFQWPEKALLVQLDRLAAAGGNVIRNTMSDRKDKGFEVYPFKRLANGKFDLNEWNDEYWDRFERLLRETSKRGIFVQIEIWDRFDYTDDRGSNRWQIHPYNPGNNVNYTYEQSGFARRYPKHPGANVQPFFFTTPRQRNNKVVLRFQQRFVGRLLDLSLRFSNVLYCMDNETSGEEQWSRYWATFVKDRAASKRRRVYVTEMWDDWNLRASSHKRTFDHPQLYGFVDVSQNNHNKGQKHWDNFLHVRRYLAGKPRPMNTTKTYGANRNKFGHSDQDGIERFWRHLLAGAASIRFHRPDAGLGLNDKAVASIRAARRLEKLVPPWTVKPATELLSGRSANEAYLSADRGRAYIVYFPAGGEVQLDLSAAKGSFTLQWIDISKGQVGPRRKLTAPGRFALSPPDRKNWVAAIARP